MKLSRFFLTACFFAFISAYQVLSQTPPRQFTTEASIVITFDGEKASVSGLVDNMSTKGLIEESVQKLLPTRSLTFSIQTGSNVRPLVEGWQSEFEKTLLDAKDWKSGVLNFKLDDEARKHLYVNYLEKAFAVSMADSTKLQLIRPGKKATLLFFFATWCGPCRTPIPILNDLYRDLSAKGLDIIALDADNESKADIMHLVQQLNVKFPVVWASDDLMTTSTTTSRFPAIPQAFLIFDGKLRHVSLGGSPSSIAELKAATEEVFKGKE